ncbi:MAG: septum formation initiator family protein [Methylacidiphilales bacterium]|nr:septum formation initiator family protein [Candidatus Methylacidiphilales bacterium]MDW8349803.1 septum formation initiator family protein [Verrucomicrobiae bacterium]
MSRNRRLSSANLHWAPILGWGAMLVFLAVLGLLFLHYKNQIITVAEETARLEKEYALLRQRTAVLQADLDNLKAPQELKRRIRNYNFVSINEVPVIYIQRGNDRIASHTQGGAVR